MTRDERNAKRRAWYAANLERQREYQRRAREQHPERYRKATLDWYYRNRDEATRKWREKRAADPDASNARVRAWREKNQEHLKEYNRRTQAQRNASTKLWIAANRDKKRAQWQRYDARKRGASGNGLTAADWSEIRESFCGLCAYCLRHCANPEQDHVIALTLGGAHDAENVVPACKACNSSKKDHSLLRWIVRGGTAGIARAA